MVNTPYLAVPLDALQFNGNLGRPIAVSRLGGTLELPSIAVGVAGRPEPRLRTFYNAHHIGEKKSENKKFKIWRSTKL